MIETGIYVSESEKEAILRRYEEEASWAKERQDEEDLGLVNDESFSRSIELLKEKNLLSLNLILSNMFAREEIAITDEVLDELMEGMNSEDKELYRRILSESDQKMGINRIRTMFLNSDSMKSLEIPLTPELSQNYKKTIELFTKKFKGSQEEVLERLMNGVIRYEDIEKLTKTLQKAGMVKDIDFIELFENGRIDISQMRRKNLARYRRGIY